MVRPLSTGQRVAPVIIEAMAIRQDLAGHLCLAFVAMLLSVEMQPTFCHPVWPV